MRWAEIALAADSPERRERAATLLTEVAGCHGFAESEGAVTGYLPVDERLEGTLRTLKAALDGGDITIRFVAEEDWAHAWKQYFKPQRIGQRLVIKPSWEAYAPEPADLVIEMDPGMAFGTGLHATTRLCLQGLEARVTPGVRVADVGTGSGILAVAAILLGAEHVAATDNDPLAVRIARENAQRNGLSARITVDEASLPPPGTFGLITANILADIILAMADELVAALAPGGVLIASGIIDTRADAVHRGLEAAGLTWETTETEGEWVAIHARRPL
jgi:ribosomal protein L11 methyltransferase